jgi:hypothetical protein
VASKQKGGTAAGQRRPRGDGTTRKPARKAHENAEEVIVLTW